MKVEVMVLSLNTRPKGKTEVVKGNFKNTGGKLIMISEEGEVVFHDVDSYTKVQVQIERAPQRDNSLKWAHGVELIRGPFVIRKIKMDPIQGV